jgi:hypothetical protein
MEIKLNPAQILMATHIGLMRQTMNTRDGKKHAAGLTDARDWQIHCEGCLGEFAVAVFLDAHWCGSVGNYEAPDVSDCVEVRTTDSMQKELVIRRKDKDDRIFVSVVGKNGTYTIRGWIYCWEAKKRKDWFKTFDHRPKAYFVPTESLHHPNTLKAAFYQNHLLPRINSLLNEAERNQAEAHSD